MPNVHRRSTSETETTPSPGERYGLAERRQKQLDAGAGHVDLDEIHTVEGLFAVISQRRANGTFTFAIFKGFDRGSGLERTSFIPAALGEGWIKLAGIVLERIEQIRADGTAPFKERPL